MYCIEGFVRFLEHQGKGILLPMTMFWMHIRLVLKSVVTWSKNKTACSLSGYSIGRLNFIFIHNELPSPLFIGMFFPNG
jgi:hypothetical protein